MPMYAMLGRYSTDAVKGMSGNRTRKATALIEKHGGRVEAMYAMLGERDLLLIVDLSDTAAAVKVSIGLWKLTGIAFSTSPALPAAEFDQLAADA